MYSNYHNGIHKYVNSLKVFLSLGKDYLELLKMNAMKLVKNGIILSILILSSFLILLFLLRILILLQ